MHFIRLTLLFSIIFGTGLISCNSNSESEKPAIQSPTIPKEDVVFFPVTDYINGEIRDIWENNSSLTQYNDKGQKTDSSILKNDTLSMRNYFSAFMTPAIDSVLLSGEFKCSKFMDETIGSITLMYERIKPADSLPAWVGWNVYIKPETGLVEKIYLNKQIDSVQSQQLIWTHGKGCQIRTFGISQNGNTELIKEWRVKW